MEARGRLNSITKDFLTDKPIVSFVLDHTPAEMEKLRDCDLDIVAKKHRERRSLDANAYAWVLLQKIAEAIQSDKDTVYMEMLMRYSRAFRHVICRPEAAEEIKRAFRTCEELGEVTVHGQTGTQLRVYIGSSQFDTKQMSVFLDGIVSEAQELGIDTRTPDEIRKMEEVWGV